MVNAVVSVGPNVTPDKGKLTIEKNQLLFSVARLTESSCPRKADKITF
jgi:hypothetical protein